MAIKIEMPRLSDTMEEGTLNQWRVKVGDKVSAGDVLADVETDKATMELQVFDEGTIAMLGLEEGETTSVGNVIVILAEEGESIEQAIENAGDISAGGSSSASKEVSESNKESAQGSDSESSDSKSTATATAEENGNSSGKSSSGSSGRIRVSPVARKMAEENDLDLAAIEGSGPDGRIIKRDIQKILDGGGQAAKSSATSNGQAASAPAMTAPKLESKSIGLSNMRKTIAKRLVESKTSVPHFQVTMSIRMDALLKLRADVNQQLESQGIKLSVNDYIVRACCVALMQNPTVNSSWAEDSIQQHGTVNIGVAVALPEDKGGGLVVPVLKGVQGMSLRDISSQTRALATKARETGLSLDDMSDSTFTISNLGMYGVNQFNAIINPPNAAILAVGAAIEKPVVEDGQIVVGSEMNATLSADHRVVDGATAAIFMQSLKQIIETPASMLV